MRSGIAWLLSAAVRRRSFCTAVHFACPICQSELLPITDNEHGLRCANSHFTNVAKEGYAFLLKKPMKKNAELEARTRAERAFFEAGGFSAQADALADEVIRALQLCPQLPEGSPHHVLNAGCGEGLWLRRVAQRLEARGSTTACSTVQLWGTDQNKLAVRYASKRQRAAQFGVCKQNELPFADGTFSVVFTCFAPSPWDEFCRVLRPGGVVIVARAGSRHLHELRAKLLPLRSGAPLPGVEPPKQFSAGLAENYVRVCTEQTYGEDATSHLLAMTAWGEPEQKVRVLAELESAAAAAEVAELPGPALGLTATVDLIISTHRVWLGTGGEPI